MKMALIISNLGQGGAERVLSLLANYFCEKNDVTIIKLDNAPSFYEISPKIRLINANLGVGDMGIIGNFKKRFGKIFAIRKLFKSQNFDIIISFLDNTNVLSLIANFGLKTPLIISEHTNHTFLKARIWRVLKRIFYPRASGLSVLTRFDYYFYTYVKNREIMPNPAFSSLIDEQNLKKMCQNKRDLILAVGRLEPFKGFDALIRAISLIPPQSLKNYEIIIAGDGHERENLENLAHNLGVKVQFAGFCKDIANLYAQAKIVVVTSRAEGFCNILAESIFFDTARISTDCIAGPRDLITHEKDGILCAVDDEKEIAKAINLLINDENCRLNLVKNANLRRDELSLKTIGKKWEIFIDKTLQMRQNRTNSFKISD